MLAGMRDRGATCAVVEVANPSLRAGYYTFLELAVAVHTDISNMDVEDDVEREATMEAQLGVFDTLIDSSAQVSATGIILRARLGGRCRPL